MDTIFPFGHAIRQQQMQIAVCAAYERQAQESAAHAAQQVVMRARMAVAGIIFADHRVGMLDAETVGAFGMRTEARAVRNTAQSRQHVIESRRAEGDFDHGVMVQELEFALANVVLFEPRPSRGGRVNLIVKRPRTRERFLLLHLRLDVVSSEWLLESFNRIGRQRAVAARNRISPAGGAVWSLTPAAHRAVVRGKSPFG